MDGLRRKCDCGADLLFVSVDPDHVVTRKCSRLGCTNVYVGNRPAHRPTKTKVHVRSVKPGFEWLQNDPGEYTVLLGTITLFAMHEPGASEVGDYGWLIERSDGAEVVRGVATTMEGAKMRAENMAVFEMAIDELVETDDVPPARSVSDDDIAETVLIEDPSF